MGEELAVLPPRRHGETATHIRLKRLALIWAQAHGYRACGLEVRLPHCRYRADLATYRSKPGECTAVFECKQALADLRKDSRSTARMRERLATVCRRRAVLENHLRIHYPHLRAGDSLFPEFDAHRFEAIDHRAYRRVLAELQALQTQLHAGTKFEKLLRYQCANVFYLVMPHRMGHEREVPSGWGILLEKDAQLELLRKPTFRETSAGCRRLFLEQIAACGTRASNRMLGIDFEEVWQKRAAD